MKLINGMKPSEWVKSHRSAVRADIMDADLLAWGNPGITVELYLTEKRNGLREIIRPTGCPMWTESRKAREEGVFIGEIYHGRNPLDDAMKNMRLSDIEDIFIREQELDDDRLADYNLWKKLTPNVDRLAVIDYFKDNTRQYQKAKKLREMTKVTETNYESLIDAIIQKLEQNERNEG